MSRSSPLVAPIIDEDFDLCISETNLPFPYSDHCSTGPPSVYEFDVEEDEEEIEEEEEEEDEEEEDEGGDEDEDDTLVETREVVLDGDSDSDPALTIGAGPLPASLVSPRPDTDVRRSPSRSRNAKQLSDLSDQLHSRLELIQADGSSVSTPKAAAAASRPPYGRQSYSFDSNEGWHEEDEEDEEHHLHHGHHQEKDTNEDTSRGVTGLVQTMTSSITSVAYAVGKHWSKKIYESLLNSHDPKAYYTHLLSAATNYEQWSEAAIVLDRLQGKDQWKSDPRSPHYDYEMLQERLSALTEARKSGDLGLMIYLLRTSLSRNLGNVGRPQLYANTIIGTKRLIEDYNAEVMRQLNIICDTESDDFSMAAKLEFFTHTRQAFGRTALLLSGGATMGLMHIGVIKTLYYNQLLPRIISGSSCGSIIAAILCTRTDEEISDMFQFEKFNLAFFHTVEETGDVLARLIHFLKNGALFDAQVLKAALRDNIGDVTFQEAYNRTRRILNVTVSTSATFEMPRLLNYLTAPNVLIWSAVATSSAAPFIYNSAPLMAKDKNGDEVQWNPSRYHWIDGSVDNDLPMNKLSELFNVNHFIVCQVNPYIVPFLHNSLARSPSNRVLGWMLYQARSELQLRMNQLSILGVMPGLLQKVQAIMSQRYYGDITIVPDLEVDDYLNIVTNPSIDFLIGATLKGERATWPKISIIKNHCSIEHCLDDILYRLRLRRLEAYRPPANAAPSKQTTGSTEFTLARPHMPAASTSASAAVRATSSSASAAVGRSNSSPASPAASVILGRAGMTPMASGPVNTGLDFFSGLTPSTPLEDAVAAAEISNHATAASTAKAEVVHAQSRGRSSLEVPISTAAVVQQSKSGSRQQSSGGGDAHTLPPTLRRANSSSAPSQNSMRATGATVEGGKTILRHRNSFSDQTSRYSDITVKTFSSTNSTGGSINGHKAPSSAPPAMSLSPRIVFTPSMPDPPSFFSPLDGGITQFSQTVLAQSGSSAVPSPTLLSTAALSAMSTPVPVVVQTNNKSRSSKKLSSTTATSTTLSTTSSSSSTTSSQSSGPSRNRNKRNLKMTSIQKPKQQS